MNLSEQQHFMLEALGRHGASILLPKRWSDVSPRLEAIWVQSPTAKGVPWSDVEPIARKAWRDELQKFAESRKDNGAR